MDTVLFVNATIGFSENLFLVYICITVRGPTRGRMLISEFCTACLQSDKSDLYICNSEIKQSQSQPIRVPH